MLVLLGELPVGLQLELQVWDRVGCWCPAPGVCQVRAEAQVQAQTPSAVAMAHLLGLSSMPIIPIYAATDSTPSARSFRVWAITSRLLM